MKKIIGFIVQKKRLFLLLFLLIVSLIFSLSFSSYSWAINPTVKKDGYVKITNIKNGDIIPNKKDVVVEYSADSMTMPIGGVKYIGRIRYLILTVDGEPYGTYENSQDKGTYTFQIDLSKLDDETPVKLQALGYLHTAPKSLIRLWEQKRMKIDQLQNLLKSLAQFKSEEIGVSKDNNPNDLSSRVDADTHNSQEDNSDYKDPTIVEPQDGLLQWRTYTYRKGVSLSWWPSYSIEYPSIWRKKSEGNVGFEQPHSTTGVSISFLPVPCYESETLNGCLEAEVKYYTDKGYISSDVIVDGKNGKKVEGLAEGTPYIHEGDYSEKVFIPYEESGEKMLIELSFLNDKTQKDQKDLWNHMLLSLHLLTE